MDFAIGLSIAYMKILSLAAVIMALVWAAAKVSLALHQKMAARKGLDEAQPRSPDSGNGSE
ncbi:MAG: hypothetical protein ISR51_05940 [Rhodospirillales bacterium]|nr:hypothetical protein [Alphaproteobacteria bacterium]MBL6948199.1 hypothetical protein [Rhodospirillales bacterium]